MIKYFAIRNVRATCSSVEMLKGYMVRERLKTPDFQGRRKGFSQDGGQCLDFSRGGQIFSRAGQQ